MKQIIVQKIISTYHKRGVKMAQVIVDGVTKHLRIVREYNSRLVLIDSSEQAYLYDPS